MTNETTLAKEVLKLDSLCRSPSKDEKEKESQLKKTAELARTVLGCDCEYNPKDDSKDILGGGC